MRVLSAKVQTSVKYCILLIARGKEQTFRPHKSKLLRKKKKTVEKSVCAQQRGPIIACNANFYASSHLIEL